MDKHLIPSLKCVYCGSSFRLEKVFRRFPSGSVRFGVLRCDCDVFPIVEGIVYLKKSAPPVLKNQHAVTLMYEGKFSEVVGILFDEHRRAKIPYTLLRSGLFHPKTLIGFLRLLRLFIPESRAWWTHLMERERRPTFVLALSNLSDAPQGNVILDVGCSVGWFLKYALAHAPGNTYVGVETSFSALFLARQFLLKKNATLICADADLGLPFRTGSIDRVFANDTFMYFTRKRFFLTETQRIGTKKSLVFLSHVHSARRENMGQGYGLTARELDGYAQEFSLRVASDETLFAALQTGQPLPYKKLSERKSVLRSPSCSLIISRSAKFPVLTPPPWLRRFVRATDFHFVEDPQLRL